MIDPTTKVHRNPRAVFRRLAEGSGGVLLHLDSTQYHGVNEVGAAIWELTESDIAFGELVAALRGRLDDPPADLEGDVESFLTELRERELVQLQAAGS
jgi:coenzyme PQQ synthesis protein D (PqqD)